MAKKIMKLDWFSVLMVAAFLLLASFITYFFLVMGQPGYWHFADIGAYLTRSFFAINKGFFAEVPYWNYGYHLFPFAIYPPLFFVVNVAIYQLSSLVGLRSIYGSFFATFILSYVFAFLMTLRISKKGALAYLLAAGNFFSLGLLVLSGFNTKIFAFNLCFPAIVWLLDRRKDLELSNKAIAAFSLLLAAVFASQTHIFAIFSIFYLSIVLQNRKARLKGLIPFAFIPILTLPYFASFVLSLGETFATADVGVKLLGLSLNYYNAILVAFILLALLTRERVLAPLALLAAIFALNLNTAIPFLETNSTAFFISGIICYYIVNYNFAEKIPALAKKPQWLQKQHVLVAALFVLLLLNFAYFPQRIEKVNLFNNPEYGPLLEYGALESVFFVADIAGEDGSIGIYTSYQTFYFHNYSVNDWFTYGRAHAEFKADKERLVEAIKSYDCGEVSVMVEKMHLKTLVIKNLPAGFSCDLELVKDFGKFEILSAQ